MDDNYRSNVFKVPKTTPKFVRVPPSRRKGVSPLPDRVSGVPGMVEDSEIYASEAACDRLGSVELPSATILIKQHQIPHANLIGSYAFRVYDQYRRIEWLIKETRQYTLIIDWWLKAPSMLEIVGLEQAGKFKLYHNLGDAYGDMIRWNVLPAQSGPRHIFLKLRHDKDYPLELP